MSSYNSSTNKSNKACWDAATAPVVVVVVVVVVLRALAAVAVVVAAVACCFDGGAWRSCCRKTYCSLSGGTPSQSWASPRLRAHSRWTSKNDKKHMLKPLLR